MIQSTLAGVDVLPWWMRFGALIKPTDPLAFWTCILAVSTAAVVIVAIRGLQSLKLARADMITRATRQARACALARCEEWAKSVIPQNGEILTAFSAAKVPVFIKDAKDVAFDPDNSDHVKIARDWWQALPPGISPKIITQLNALEAWSMYFIHELADSRVAFGPCAPTFCSQVVQFYAVLLVIRTGGGSGKFPNTIALYKKWIAELGDHEKGKKMASLLKELEQLQAKGPGQPDTLPLVPLGTKLDV